MLPKETGTGPGHGLDLDAWVSLVASVRKGSVLQTPAVHNSALATAREVRLDSPKDPTGSKGRLLFVTPRRERR